jgi:hypothetical protein
MRRYSARAQAAGPGWPRALEFANAPVGELLRFSVIAALGGEISTRAGRARVKIHQ